jgi:hypothetical protein
MNAKKKAVKNRATKITTEKVKMIIDKRVQGACLELKKVTRQIGIHSN